MANDAKTLMAPGARLRVSVTADDIAGARRGDSFECVLVIALARTVPNGHSFTVTEHTIRFTLEGQRFEYRGHPWSVEDYVRDFDAGIPPAPFTFWVHKPRVKPVGASRNPSGRPRSTSASRSKSPAAQPKPQPKPRSTSREVEQPPDSPKPVDPSKPGRGRPRRERAYGHRRSALPDTGEQVS